MRSLLLLTGLVASGIGGCSFLTSWDDVRVDDTPDAFVAVDAASDKDSGHDLDGGPTTFDAAPPPSDAGQPLDLSGCSCTASGAGAITVLQCDGPDNPTNDPEYIEGCSAQCVATAAPKMGASCTCRPGQLYCAGHDNLAGVLLNDKDSLWTCGADGASFLFAKHCPSGCAYGDAGTGVFGSVDDECK